MIVVYLYGASLALRDNELGYWALAVISAVGLYSVFLAHAFELSGHRARGRSRTRRALCSCGS